MFGLCIYYFCHVSICHNKIAIFKLFCVLFVSYHICEAEDTIEQEALSSASQQDLMSGHGAAQHLPVKPQAKNDPFVSGAIIHLSHGENDEVP